MSDAQLVLYSNMAVSVYFVAEPSSKRCLVEASNFCFLFTNIITYNTFIVHC